MQHPDTKQHNEYRQTLLRYYEEEVMGEAYFHALAEHFDGAGEAEKLHLLGDVERCAAQTVEPLLAKHGLTPRDRDVLTSEGAAEIAPHKDCDWRQFVAHMIERYPGYVDDFEALERLAPGEDLPWLKLLTRHEIVAIEFAEREAAGDPDSTAPLRAYLQECAEAR